MRVIKLGGSLMEGPWLRPWLAAATLSPEAVIVPGGGLFADTVRQAHAFWEFGESTAHRMALLAMDQFGLMLAAMDSRLTPFTDPNAIPDTVAAGRVPLWLPYGTLGGGHPDVPECWELTSDSLALWLATQIQARELVLVKSVDPPGGTPDMRALSEAGIVDPAFPALLATFPLAVRILGPDSLPEPDQAL